jgi:hypothetical protein
VDKDKARQKEAKRTLNRIKGTLDYLQGDSNGEIPEQESKEFKRMKNLLEYGYTRNSPGLIQRIKLLIVHPIFLVLIILLLLLLLAGIVK